MSALSCHQEARSQKRVGSVVKVFGSASDFPEPIAKSQAAPLTAERKLKKQDPWQVGPVETRLANPSESALWACHTSLSYAKSTTAMRGAE